MSFPTPNIPLEEMTLRQLRRVASEYEVSRYSRMRKVELVAAIMQKQIAAGLRTAPAESPASLNGQVQVEAAKYANPAQEYTSSPSEVGSHTSPTATAIAAPPQNVPESTASFSKPSMEVLATVDDGLGELPDGYGESRIVLLPRDPQWAYTYWDIPNEHKQELRNQGGSRLALPLLRCYRHRYQQPESSQPSAV